TFNGSAATFSVNLAGTQITTSVPSAATNGAVKVTNPGGTATGPSFTVGPKITSFSTSAAFPGASITINGTGLTSVFDVSFNGTSALVHSLGIGSSVT